MIDNNILTSLFFLSRGNLCYDNKAMIIFAYDGLEPKMVEKFGCKNLQQVYHGQTDLSEFKLLRTIVLWASFLTGKNMDRQFHDKDEQWSFRIPIEHTFVKFFKKARVIDLPAFNYDQKKHEKERLLLKAYFEEKITIERYDNFFWQNHKKIKKEFFQELKNDWPLLVPYFNLADAIGHLSFGIEEKMEKIYAELNEIVKITRRLKPKEAMLIISDHGMKTIGRYGDHDKHGFFSFSEKIDLVNPKITEFFSLLQRSVLPDF